MTNCPRDDQLRAMLSSDLDGGQADWIERHVTACEACQRRLDAMTQDALCEQWRETWRETQDEPADSPTDGRSRPADRLKAELPAGADSCASGRDTDVGDDGRTSRQLLEQLGTFRDLRERGRGSFGIVFEASSTLHPKVAVKILKPSRATDRKEVERLQREGRAAAAVEDDHVVRIYQVGATSEPLVPFLVMELIEGESLQERLRREAQLEARGAAEIARQAALGLHAAHARGLIHRDIKPSNLLLQQGTDRVKITDFGLAFAEAELVSQATPSETIAGTLHYMSPEQIQDPRSVEARSDVYSLGVVLFEMLIGERPYRGVGHALMLQVVHDEPPAPRTLDSAIPRDLDTIVQRCLANLPSRRYATARELADDLERFLRGEPIQARPVRGMEWAVRWCCRRPWQAAAVGLAALAILLAFLAAVVLLRSAVREQRLRESAEAMRDEAEQGRALALARQLQYQLELTRVALENAETATARAAVEAVPAALRSWDTRAIERRLTNQPRVIASLVDGHWGIIAGDIDAGGTRLVTADSGGRVIVWDLNSGRVLRRLAEGRWSAEKRRWLHHYESRPEGSRAVTWGPCYTALCWLPETNRIMAASLDGAIWSMDAATGVTNRRFVADEPLHALALAGDHASLLAGGAAGGLYLLSTEGTLVRHEAGRTRRLAAVQVVAAAAEPSAWFVGRADGQIDLVAAADLSVRATVRVENPVWSLDVWRQSASWLLAVASDEPAIRLFGGSDPERGMLPRGTLAAPEWAGQPFVQQTVHFSVDGKHVYAGDSLGRVTRWHSGSQRVTSRTSAFRPDRRRQPLAERMAALGLESPLPCPLRRIGSVVLERPGTNQLITAGDDAAVKIWTNVGDSASGGSVLKTRAGRRPKVCFDPVSPHVLWTLGPDGMLRLVDCAADQVLAEAQAHDGSAADLAVVGTQPLVATVGGDTTVRFWRFSDGKLLAASEAEIRHDQPLISVAASPDGRWIAAVDSSARLAMWERTTRKRIGFTPLSDPAVLPLDGPGLRPLTGRVTFSCDGSKLSAFGAAQTTAVFTTTPFQRLPEQVWIAGTGGTAMMWSPIDPHVVLAADNHPRCTARAFDGRRSELDEFPMTLQATCVAAAITPDLRRVMLLEETGRLVFLESRHLLPVFELRSGLAPVADVAINASNRLLAVAGQDGSLEIWDAGEPAESAKAGSRDETGRWSSTALVGPTASTIYTDARMVQIDSNDGLGLLYVESAPSDFRNEGAMHYGREHRGLVVRERIEVAGQVGNRRASHEAAALAHDAQDRPTIVLRLRTAEESPYDGGLYCVRQAHGNRWTWETLHSHGNWGFYPLLRLSADSKLVEVVHFSYDGFYVVRSTPNQRGDGEWQAEKIGLQGDGLRMSGKWDAKGHLHLVFDRNRFNSDPAPRMYACWDGRRLRSDVIDPLQPISLRHVEFSPDGSPVVLLGRRLLQATSSGWQEYARLPPLPAITLAIGPQGEVFLATWDHSQQRLLLWQGQAGRWSAKAVAGPFAEGEPDWWTMRFDHEQRPVLVVGRLGDPYGWLRIVRPVR